jgi:hypothetical protein
MREMEHLDVSIEPSQPATKPATESRRQTHLETKESAHVAERRSPDAKAALSATFSRCHTRRTFDGDLRHLTEMAPADSD